MYSNSQLLISTRYSILSGESVFVGNQPDDFALAGTLAPGPRMCLLGTGYGAALRPIAVFRPDARITSVDSSSNLNSVARAIHEEHFPEFEFSTVTEDARTFLAHQDQAFDAVCVDLYSLDGHAECVFDPQFWELVRASLAPDGVALANAWGLPAQLNQFAPPSAQHDMAHAMSLVWPEVRHIANRRNATLIAGGVPEPPRSRPPEANLRKADQAVAELLLLREARALPVETDLRSARSGSVDRQSIAEEMHARWPAMVMTLETAAERCGHPRRWGRPENLLSHPDAADDITWRLLEAGRPEADFLPILAAALAFEGCQDGFWFGPWAIQNWKILIEQYEDWFISVALWQALAMISCPLTPQPEWADELVDVVRRSILAIPDTEDNNA